MKKSTNVERAVSSLKRAKRYVCVSAKHVAFLKTRANRKFRRRQRAALRLGKEGDLRPTLTGYDIA